MYDCHLFFEHLLTKAYNQNYTPTVIPKCLENYDSVQVGCLRFLDSYLFLSSSLQEPIACINTTKDMDSDDLQGDLFRKKSAYPYEKFNLENKNH